MPIERTLSIIKPDATRRNLTGAINDRFEKSGLRIVAQKRLHLSKDVAGKFYAVHAARPFYDDLVSFMSSGPVVVQVLEGENAIAKNRDINVVKRGDLGVFMTAGAYGATMASTYNSRALVPEALVDGDRYAVVADRIAAETVMAAERVPDWL